MAEEKESDLLGEKQNAEGRIRAENFVRFYANNIQVNFTQWDMRITFGQIVDDPNGKLMIEEQASVVMSLQHAKAAIHILAQSFAEFENRVGKIPLVQLNPS